MDCVELRRQYGRRIAFCGNSDMRVWETVDRDAIRREAPRKLAPPGGRGLRCRRLHAAVWPGVSGDMEMSVSEP